MFRYRLHSPDGDDLGEQTYAQMIKPGEEIIAGSNEHFSSSTWCRSRRTASRRSSGCYRSRAGVSSLAACAGASPLSSEASLLNVCGWSRP